MKPHAPIPISRNINKSISTTNQNPRVSIVTITQGSRINFLKLQADNVANQMYKNIIEWVIVDGSNSQDDSSTLAHAIDEIKSKININFIKSENHQDKIGRLRNKANQNTKGDIIINFDDDDYYMPTHVSHIVDTFNKHPNYQVAGCANVYIYDFRWNALVQGDLAPKYNNTSNNCIAYRSSYAKTHFYNETTSTDEESDFLEMPPNSIDCKVPIKQLDPDLTTIHFIHGTNTAKKNRIILSSFYDVAYCTKPTKEIDVLDLINDKHFALYKEAFSKQQQEICKVYDIVYFCGFWSIKWSPTDLSLGGSEHAVVNITKEWAKQGYRVAVYAEVPHKQTFNGVDYYPTDDFTPPRGNQKIHTLILWRNFGSIPFLRSNVASSIINNIENIFIDLHDNDPNMFEMISKNLYKFPNLKLFFKSNNHLERYEQATCSTLEPNQYAIILNGVRTHIFSDMSLSLPTTRNPYRFVYASCYSRGLDNILERLWKELVKKEPRTELHLYYGMKMVRPELKERLQKLINETPNVCDHGRQSNLIVAREKQLSTFHLYITDHPEEIDCISIRESLASGCIPILLNAGVFKERDGVKINIGTTIPETIDIITNLINNPEKCTTLREQLLKSDTIKTWTEIATEWTRHMTTTTTIHLV